MFVYIFYNFDTYISDTKILYNNCAETLAVRIDLTLFDTISVKSSFSSSIPTTMATFETIKFIDTDTKYIVTGFIRKVQLSFTSNTIYHTIPEVVANLCLLYYYNKVKLDYDPFRMYYNEKENTIVNHNETSTAYGNNVIPNDDQSIHEWKFEILKYKLSDYLAFGLIEATDKIYYNGGFYNYGSTLIKRYAYKTSGLIRNHGRFFKLAPESETGDIITMTFDGKNKSLSFQVNKDQRLRSVDVEKVIMDINMPISLANKQDTIRLLSYKCMAASD